jgi:hypothetical protein
MSQNRFAISMLSKSRKAEAINEELMVDKSTGEILIRGVAGEYVSYNRLARFESHINRVTEICHRHNFLGKVYSLELDDYDTPMAIPETTNLLASGNQVLSLNKKLRTLYLSLDLDCLNSVMDQEKTMLHMKDTVITAQYSFGYNATQDIELTETVVLPLSEFNITMLRPEYPDWTGDDVDYDVKLKTLSVARDPIDAPLDLRMILHSAVCVIKEVS